MPWLNEYQPIKERAESNNLKPNLSVDATRQLLTPTKANDKGSKQHKIQKVSNGECATFVFDVNVTLNRYISNQMAPIFVNISLDFNVKAGIHGPKPVGPEPGRKDREI